MKRSKTYMYKPQEAKDIESIDDPSNGLRFSKHNLTITKIHVHPWHKMQVNPHLMEGFNYLASNLVAENPEGSIMTYTPMSGKTFKIIFNYFIWIYFVGICVLSSFCIYYIIETLYMLDKPFFVLHLSFIYFIWIYFEIAYLFSILNLCIFNVSWLTLMLV